MRRKVAVGNGKYTLCINHDSYEHPSLSNIIDISKGSEYTLVKTSNNKIYAFGEIELTNLGKTEACYTMNPTQVFEGKEDIWHTKSRSILKAKSARSIMPRT